MVFFNIAIYYKRNRHFSRGRIEIEKEWSRWWFRHEEAINRHQIIQVPRLVTTSGGLVDLVQRYTIIHHIAARRVLNNRTTNDIETAIGAVYMPTHWQLVFTPGASCNIHTK